MCPQRGLRSSMVCSSIRGSSSWPSMYPISKLSILTGICSPSAVLRPSPHVYRYAFTCGSITCAHNQTSDDENWKEFSKFVECILMQRGTTTRRMVKHRKVSPGCSPEEPICNRQLTVWRQGLGGLGVTESCMVLCKQQQCRDAHTC